MRENYEIWFLNQDQDIT